jgi:hypothetical protein
MSGAGAARLLLALLVVLASLPLQACAGQPEAPAQYLYLWTASQDSSQPDFLAVLDVTERDGRYGRLVTTILVPGQGNVPQIRASGWTTRHRPSGL